LICLVIPASIMTSMNKVVTSTNIEGYPFRQGKVRDIYDLGDKLLIVACDRISAFDVVIPSGIDEKGRVLTRLSKFWLDRFPHQANHLLEVIEDRAPSGLEAYLEQLRGRAMLCTKCEVVPIECVVRGYITGSGWKDYQRTQAICGIRLPEGLQQCQQLTQPIFTPSTKATEGHDENISFEQACDLVGSEVMKLLREKSLAIYQEAAEYARQRGVIIADTKFEWGRIGNEYLLIDEVLTPDSSRFWPASDYEIGRDQDSFDKQYVRNYLQSLCDQGLWDKSPPAPILPPEVVANTAGKYVEAYELLTDQRFVGT